MILTDLLDYVYPLIRFPKPTGKYLVSKKNFYFKDLNRKELHSKNNQDLRELLVSIWYPAKNNSSSSLKKMLYMPDVVKFALKDVTSRTYIPVSLFSKFINLATNTIENGEIEAPESVNGHPVIIFSHGLGGICDLNTANIEELVSHGYVIIGIDHTYTSYVSHFPDGRAISMNSKFCITMSKILKSNLLDKISLVENELDTWVEDIKFVIQEFEKLNSSPLFENKLNLDNIGIFGHSLGGGLAAEMCRRDSRFKAGISLDGSVTTETAEVQFSTPFMFIVGVLLGYNLCPSEDKLKSLGVNKDIWNSIVGKYKDNIHKVCKSIGQSGYYITLNGAGHFAFTDISLICPFIKNYLTFDIGPAYSFEITKIINSYLLSFFDKYLKHKPEKLNNIINSNKFGYSSKIIKNL